MLFASWLFVSSSSCANIVVITNTVINIIIFPSPLLTSSGLLEITTIHNSGIEILMGWDLKKVKVKQDQLSKYEVDSWKFFVDMSTSSSNLLKSNMEKEKSSTFEGHLKTHPGEKYNKCNQCNYASVRTGHLRRHMKTHSGEKSYTCNQCNYAAVEVNHLRTHLIIWGKIPQMQPVWLCLCSGKQVEATSKSSLWRKVAQMQPMWLCFCLGRRFEETFENSLWWKIA